jgi:hypothetical protein
VAFPVFDNLSEQSGELIRKQNENPEHQVLGYLAVPFYHDVVSAAVFFESAVQVRAL